VDKITLDREVFKALASDTRLDILKALDVRQKTVTELAKELDLNKATVFEHLEKLALVNLIQKQEEDVERKWVYWQLTWTGRRLLHPEKITLALLLSSAMGTLLTAFAAAWLWWQSNVAAPMTSGSSADALATPEDARAYDAPSESGGQAASAAPMASKDAGPDPGAFSVPDVVHDRVYLAIAVVLALVFVGLVAYALWYWRRRKAADAVDAVAA
jgi:DNA-binding transcriptional ArsR family regulator